MIYPKRQRDLNAQYRDTREGIKGEREDLEKRRLTGELVSRYYASLCGKFLASICKIGQQVVTHTERLCVQYRDKPINHTSACLLVCAGLLLVVSQCAREANRGKRAGFIGCQKCIESAYASNCQIGLVCLGALNLKEQANQPLRQTSFHYARFVLC